MTHAKHKRTLSIRRDGLRGGEGELAREYGAAYGWALQRGLPPPEAQGVALAAVAAIAGQGNGGGWWGGR
jgi:hypothetical protein